MATDAEILVSIRCLAYNQEKYIRQCLDGFVSQITSFRFEAIVHDDASTDGTAEIIQEYARRYPDIIIPIFESENQYSKHDGSIKRRMDAEMRGKYIALCEGDDYWEDPLKLQKQVNILETNPDIMAVVTNCKIVNQAGDTLDEFKSSIVKNNVEGRYNLRDFIINQHQYPTPTVLYRNSSFDAIDKVQTALRNNFFGDWVLWFAIHTVGDFFFLNQVTSAYRINPTSLTHSDIDNRRLGLAKANFEINRKIQQILPPQYEDLRKGFDDTSWIWFKLAIAYKHIHKYIPMLYSLVRSFLRNPMFFIKRCTGTIQ